MKRRNGLEYNGKDEINSKLKGPNNLVRVFHELNSFQKSKKLKISEHENENLPFKLLFLPPISFCHKYLSEMVKFQILNNNTVSNFGFLRIHFHSVQAAR